MPGCRIHKLVYSGQRETILGHALFKSTKSTQIFHFPFAFFTWTIEEKEEDKMEALEIVALTEGKKTKTMRIGIMLSPEMRTRLV